MSDQSPKIEPVEFKKGDILFSENESSYHFFIIQEGQVEIYKSSPEGERTVLATVGEGLSIGEFAMIDRRPRSATARAITDVNAMKISESAYKELLEELPDWAVSVMTALVDRLRSTNEIVRKLSIGPAAQKAMAQVEFDDSKVRKNPLLSGEDEDYGDTPDLA